MLTRLLAPLFAALLIAMPAVAQTPAVSDANASVAAVQTYLQSLRTLSAKFVQTAPDGTQVGGDFLLKRPGRMRFDYAAPVTDFIVADGRFIYYYDGQMKETANAPISQSLADFFLRDKITLSGDIKVTDVKTENDLLMVTVVQAKDAGAGSLTMGLTTTPRMQLKKWRINDAQGGITEVELFEIAEGISIDSNRFDYYDPNRRDRGYN